MAITLKDVASVAGVSTATVSRALAGSERVAPQTATHIRSVAKDLGYRFDNVARALRQKRSNLVGLILPDYAIPYARDLLRALNQELYRAEFVLAAMASFGSCAKEFVQVERLLGQRIDALLIVPVDPVGSAAAIEIALAEDIPVYQLYRHGESTNALAVHLNYQAGVEFALRYLRGRPIKSIRYHDDPAAFAAAAKRDAFQAAMANLGRDASVIVDAPPSAPPSLAPDVLGRQGADSHDIAVCASADVALRLDQVMAASSIGGEGTTIICLDPVPDAALPVAGSFISVEYPLYSMARNLIYQISSALKRDGELLGHVSVQPFMNLSRYRDPAL